jgi:hypothetical protein
MAAEFFSRLVVAVQYVQGGGAEVLAAVQRVTQFSGNAWAIVSENGTLVLSETDPIVGLRGTWTIQQGQYVVIDLNVGIVAMLAPDQMANRYRPVEAIVVNALRDHKDDIVRVVGTALATDPTFIAAVARAVKGSAVSP